MNGSMLRGAKSGEARGFTLIELMAVIAILGILAAIAIAAYTKNVRSARRTEVIGDLSNIALKQRNVFAVRGHYVTASDDEDDTFPVAPNQLQSSDLPLHWTNLNNNAAYHKNAEADAGIYKGGGYEHGWDALNFVHEGAESWCAYGTVSGDGTNGETGTDPYSLALGPLSTEVFPNGTVTQQAYYARDWFYAFAKCDLDQDGVLWEFTIANFSSDVSDGDGTKHGE